ncbi:MAG: hypothetical protein DRP94_05420 [Candidatus Latescibacterota bacterium]|nr:MAG: hypothetical protein DRP94_05420 [Candidatus Latescibacterota bacterium]
MRPSRVVYDPPPEGSEKGVNMEDVKAKAEQMLRKMKQKRSDVPKFLEFMAEELPEIFVRHQQDKQFAMHFGELPEKCKVLICLAISAALNQQDMVRSYMIAGKDHGATDEEMLQAILLARFVKASTVLKDGTEAMMKLRER